MRRWGVLVLAAFLARPFRAADLPDYSRGVNWFPKFWRAYSMPSVPRPNLANSRMLLDMIQGGKVDLSIARLDQLVEQNSLDLIAARYDVDIAETDILRAKSGQAARGVPGAGLPVELFSSAVGAGVGAASSFIGGGTGPAAISGSGRQVNVSPHGTFDPDIQVVFSFDHASSPLNTLQVAGVSTVTTPSTDVLTRFEKQFSEGFSFSVSFNSQRQSSTQRFLLFDPAYTSRLSISAVQPLLNGFGFAVNRRFLNIAHNDLKIAREAFRQSVSTALINSQNAYWNLVAARQNVESVRHALETAEKLYENTRAQEKYGAAAYLDVMQAQSAVAASRRDLVAAEAAARTQELQLKSLISKHIDALANVELVTTDSLPEPSPTDIPPLPQALQTAAANRSELVQADLNIRNREIAEKFTRSALRPTLNVFASYASSALETGISPMLGQVWWNIPYPEYAAGISLTIPLRNRSAQADNIRARLELRQERTARLRTLNQIDLSVQTAVIALTQAKAQVEAARLAVESSRTAFQAEQQKLAVGASTPYLVIQFERDLVAAQAAQTVAQVNYAKARIQLDQARGVVLQRNHISVDDVLRITAQR